MSLKFNIDRPKVNDDEIEKGKDFATLVRRFKEQSIKKAQGDESWRKNKLIRYSTVIAGVTIICTVTYLSIATYNNNKEKQHATLTTPKVKKTDHPTTTGKPAESNPAHYNKAVAKPAVKPPSDKLKAGYTSYKVNNAKGANIKHNNSSISIPRNSFVNKKGEQIVGDVTIEYREFHHPAEIIAAGIPMGHDSTGKKYNLESAGMFDIRGHRNGEPVFIHPYKRLGVDLASSTADNRFNQYLYDSISGQWKYLGPDKVRQPAQAPAVRLDKLSATGQIDDPDSKVNEITSKRIDSLRTVTERKISRLHNPPEPKKPVKSTGGRPSFKLDGSYDEFPELSAFKNVLFEVGTENKNYSRDLHDITWSDVKIAEGPVKGKNYLLTMSYRNRIERLVVYPVFSGKDYDHASEVYEACLNSYKKNLAKRSEEEKRLKAEMEAKQAEFLSQQKALREEQEREMIRLRAASQQRERRELTASFGTLKTEQKATRIFSVSRFGLYNSDCPHNTEGGTNVKPVFTINEKERPVFPEAAYLVDHKRSSVYQLNRSNGFGFSYLEDGDYSICVFRNNEIFLCSKEAFRFASENSGNKFFVKPLEGKDHNLEDLIKALEI